MSDQPMTRVLSEWIGGLTCEQLPPEVAHHAKRVVLDYLAATISGSNSGPARIVQEHLAQTEGPGAVAVLGTPLRFSAANAALANGTAAHSLEVDDGYTPGSYHPGAPVLSAVLAAAQDHGSSADQVLLATAVGFELSCRIAGAGHPATWRRGFHNTPIAGVFGAAAAVSTILDADAAQVSDALGLAGSHAGGLFEFLASGAEVKRLHAGKAGRDGVVCAQLAARGLTGPSTVLEGKGGYVHAFAGGEFDVEHLLGELGATWRMLNTYVKPYPCCRHLHGPIDAVLAMQDREAFDVDSVEAIRVETYGVAARHGHHSVDDFLDAQMSIPYAVAVTLLHGVPALEHFEMDMRQDARVRALLKKVDVVESEECARDYPRMRPARVVVHEARRERSLRVDQPYGEPSNPVSDDDLEAKFHRLVAPVLGPDRSKRIAAQVWALDNMGVLFNELSGDAATQQ
jgi:2-methylcitrate dehydratase PrpD